jgi:hypothetical protein
MQEYPEFIYGNIKSFEVPKKHNVTFTAHNKTVGVLSFTDDTLSFEGDADASAKIFIAALANCWGFPEAEFKKLNHD